MVKDTHALWKTASEIEGKSFKMGKRSQDYYIGDHWDKNTKRELERKNRAAITINEVAAKVDLLNGFQIQTRSDFKFAPVEEGDEAVSRMLDDSTHNIMYLNDFDRVESAVFLEQTAVGRGLFDVYMDYDNTAKGEVRIEKLPWNAVKFGPHEKNDLSDCEYLIKNKWYSKSKVKQIWPEKEKDLDLMFTRASETVEEPIIDNPGDQYATGTETMLPGDTKHIDIARKQIRVMELQRKKYRNEVVVSEKEGEYVESLGNLGKGDFDQISSIPALRLAKFTVFDMEIVRIAGDVLLDTDKDEEFSVIPSYAKKWGNYWYGKIAEVMDAQDEINKRHSQMIDIVNRITNAAKYYDGDTFESPSDEKDYLNRASEPGAVFKVNDSARPPQTDDGNRFPPELITAIEMESGKLREIMNIPLEASGFSEREVSGIALQEKVRQTQTANQFLFDNLDGAKRTLMKRVVRLMQDFYSPERIYRLVSNQKALTPESQAQEQINQQAIIEMLNSEDLTKYDVVITQAADAPTTRAARFAVWAQLRQQGFPVPETLMIQLSDLPNKNEVLGQLQAQAEAAAQAEAEKNETEKFKSLDKDTQNAILNQQAAPPQGGQPQ